MPIKTGQDVALNGTFQQWNGYSWVTYPKYWMNQYELVTVGHPGWRNQLGSGDTGGPFRLFKETYNISAGYLDGGYYKGFVVFDRFAGGWEDFNKHSLTPQEISNVSLDSKGTTAISRVLPTNPSAQLSTFVGELREWAPRAIGLSSYRNRVDIARSTGDEYLNVEFGWKPMVRDLRSFAHAIKHGNKIIEGYRKGSDKKIKRRYVYPTEMQTNVSYGQYVHGGTSEFASGSVSTSASSEMWFEGCFRYHVPVPDTTMGRLLEYEAYANKILGVRLTPETVWNLTPWSWAIDWLGTTGDVLHNISNLDRDGLVMQYGYIMSTQKWEQIMSAQPYNTGLKPSRVTRTQVLKQRKPATPFGFGFDMTTLTNSQIAILYALGISRR